VTQKKQGLILLIVGLFLIALSSGYRFYNARILSFKTDYVSVPSEKQTSNPIFIEIPSVGLKLSVEESAIVNGVWEISSKGASHLNESADPGESGNIVIYGHNKNSLFGPIRWLKEGEKIKVVSEDGREHFYKVVKTIITSPDDIQYVSPKDEETLTLYTCTGFLDSKRHIIVAEPVNY